MGVTIKMGQEEMETAGIRSIKVKIADNGTITFGHSQVVYCMERGPEGKKKVKGYERMLWDKQSAEFAFADLSIIHKKNEYVEDSDWWFLIISQPSLEVVEEICERLRMVVYGDGI